MTNPFPMLRAASFFRFILFFHFCSVPSLASDLSATDLRTEFRKDPLGVDQPAPRLSWKLRSPKRGAAQTAYRILVATTADRLARQEGDAWDTGRVTSDESHLIPYAGHPLEAGRTFHWAVQVWDETGSASAWSAPARWTMGRMGDWGSARWIGLDDHARNTLGLERDQLPLLRRAFTLDQPVHRALVHVTGLGSFELYANGRKVSEDVLMPGWTNYRKTVLYATYDVTESLRRGENALGVALGHGKYHIPGTPEDGRFAKYYGSFGDPKMILHLTVEFADGSSTTIVSDGTWRVAGGPTMFSSIWGGEDYDARREQPGWDAPGFDDGGWFAAPVLSGPGGRLLAQSAPPLREHETYRPVAITSPEPGLYVYDLGQNLSGWMQLSVRGPAGATVRLRPAEVLGADGKADQNSMAHDGEILFHYTLRGEGAETWHPRFTYTGFRYVQIEGATPDPVEAAERGIPLLLTLESRFVHADLEPTGRIATSSPMLDGIHRLIIQAMRSNLMSVLTDCPHREKLGWLEQVYLHAAGIQSNYCAATLYAKQADDMAEAQTETGLVPDIAPEFTVFEDGFRDSPEWGSAFILAPLAAYDHYGDAAPLEAHYEAMKRYAAYLESRRDDRGLIVHGLGDWYDIAPGPPGRSKLTTMGLTATAIYHADLQALARIARLLGQDEEASGFESHAAEVRDTFNAAFFDAATGRYDTGSQTAQAMPLALGLVPEGQEDAVLAHLVRDIEERGTHTTAGDIGHRYVLLALMAAGRSDLIVAMAVNPEPPSYAAQLLAGATTLTEAWDADPRSSQNHFMLGHLEEWLYTGLGGIRSAAPGFRRVIIHPEPVDALDHAEVDVKTVRGPIRSAWMRTGEGLLFEVTVPPGITAEIHLPAASVDEVAESGRAVREAEGVRFVGMQNGRAVFEVGGGVYRFAVQTGTALSPR